MRKTRTELAALSATNTSPFGATRMARGPPRPDATISTEKPAGRLGLAPAGIATTSAKFGVDLLIGGRSGAVSNRLKPGLSCCHPPNAAFPLSGCPPFSTIAAPVVAPASNTRATDTILIISALHQGRRISERRPRTGSVRTADDDNEAIRQRFDSLWRRQPVHALTGVKFVAVAGDREGSLNSCRDAHAQEFYGFGAVV